MIQCRTGVELPAAGSWHIAPSQLISAERRGPRRPPITYQTARGALWVSPDHDAVTLELGLLAPGEARSTPTSIWFQGALGSADRAGRWRFDGSITIDGAPAPFELVLGYQGVHARGAVPLAWFTITGAWLATRRERRGRRGRRPDLCISGDINAERGPSTVRHASSVPRVEVIEVDEASGVETAIGAPR
ncbi:MAG: hypothetical protein AAFN30_20685 [Actinomycetota bacterium]